jgi:pyridoxamine 5'-phosphate oxidase
MNPADIRRDYAAAALERAELDASPLRQFQKWFDDAVAKISSGDVNAMVLATVDKAGKPSSRTVLLKGVDERGFIFFTNYDSRKGRELAENPHAALTFYWQELERQGCVAGSRPGPRIKATSCLTAPRSKKNGAKWPRNFPLISPCRPIGAVMR